MQTEDLPLFQGSSLLLQPALSNWRSRAAHFKAAIFRYRYLRNQDQVKQFAQRYILYTHSGYIYQSVFEWKLDQPQVFSTRSNRASVLRRYSFRKCRPGCREKGLKDTLC